MLLSILMFMRDMSEIEKAWLAGLIDADGSVGINKHKLKWKDNPWTHFHPIIQICNTNKTLLEYAKLIMDHKNRIYKKTVASSTDKHNIQHKKPVYSLKVLSISDCEHVLLQILPYLIVKKQQAKLLLDFLSFKKMHYHKGAKVDRSFEKQCYIKMRELNGYDINM